MRRFRLAAALAALALPLVAARPAAAKPPTVSALFPPGARRGTTATVEAAGSFDHWPAQCRVDGDGLTVTAAEKKGTLTVVVAEDARPGVHWIRLYDQDGAASLRPFVVGTLPETTEQEPNDDPREPQKIAEPRVVVNGRLQKRGDVDGFAVELKAGAVLTADVQANRPLGSPMDGVLQVVSADGFVLAQNDDDGGRLDPRIVFEAPSDGTYVVRVFAFPATPDSSIAFAGGDSYIYRLTLTVGGFVDHAFPLAAPSGGPSEVAAVGPNVPKDGPESKLAVPAGDEPGRVVLANPAFSGTAEVRRVVGPTLVEAEPDAADQPQALADLATVSGRIDPAGDRDAFRIALKKDDERVFRVESRGFGLPLDAVLAVLDGDGKTLAEQDDAGSAADPELKFAAKADGEFVVVVRDLHGRGGPRYAYLLSVTKPAPDFALSLASDVFETTVGKEAKIAVAVERRDGFAGEIEIRALDLPEGVEAAAVVSKPGDDSAKTVNLEIKAAADAPAGSFRVVGRPKDGDGRDRVARAKLSGLDAETERPWLTVLPAPEVKQ